MGQRIQNKGISYQCFDLGEYKELLSIDADLKFRDQEAITRDAANVELKKTVSILDSRIKLTDQEASAVETRLAEKQKYLEELALKYKEQIDKTTRWRRAMMGTIAGVVALAGGFILGVSL